MLDLIKENEIYLSQEKPETRLQWIFRQIRPGRLEQDEIKDVVIKLITGSIFENNKDKPTTELVEDTTSNNTVLIEDNSYLSENQNNDRLISQLGSISDITMAVRHTLSLDKGLYKEPDQYDNLTYSVDVTPDFMKINDVIDEINKINHEKSLTTVTPTEYNQGESPYHVHTDELPYTNLESTNGDNESVFIPGDVVSSEENMPYETVEVYRIGNQIVVDCIETNTEKEDYKYGTMLNLALVTGQSVSEDGIIISEDEGNGDDITVTRVVDVDFSLEDLSSKDYSVIFNLPAGFPDKKGYIDQIKLTPPSEFLDQVFEEETKEN